MDDDQAALHHRAAAAQLPDDALAAELQCSSDRARMVGEWAEAAWALLESGRLSAHRELREQRVLLAVALLGDAGGVAGPPGPDLASAAGGPLRDVTAGYIALLQGRAAEAHGLLHGAWADRDAARSEVAALTAQRLALHAVGRLRAGEVVEWARRAVELAGPDDPARVEAQALLGLGLAWQGQPAVPAAAVAAGRADHPSRRPARGRGRRPRCTRRPCRHRARIDAGGFGVVRGVVAPVVGMGGVRVGGVGRGGGCCGACGVVAGGVGARLVAAVGAVGGGAGAGGAGGVGCGRGACAAGEWRGRGTTS